MSVWPWSSYENLIIIQNICIIFWQKILVLNDYLLYYISINYWRYTLYHSFVLSLLFFFSLLYLQYTMYSVQPVNNLFNSSLSYKNNMMTYVLYCSAIFIVLYFTLYYGIQFSKYFLFFLLYPYELRNWTCKLKILSIHIFIIYLLSATKSSRSFRYFRLDIFFSKWQKTVHICHF